MKSPRREFFEQTQHLDTEDFFVFWSRTGEETRGEETGKENENPFSSQGRLSIVDQSKTNESGGNGHVGDYKSGTLYGRPRARGVQ